MIKKFVKLLIITVVVICILGFVLKLAYYYLYDDKVVVEDYLQNSQIVLSKVGKIENLSIRRVLSFHGDEKRDPFKAYTYIVKGRTATKVVRVTLQKLCDEGEQCFEIEILE